MEIDWITIAAQIANFLILVWLLRRFLYKPITDAIAAREQKIHDRLSDAAATKRKAEEEAARIRELREDIEAQRERLIVKARQEAAALKKELEATARDEVRKLSTAWRQEIDNERATFVDELRRNAILQFYALSREALGGLAGVSLNEAIADRFIARLSELDAESIAKLRDNGSPIVVQSSFEPSDEMEASITRAVREQISVDAQIDYQLADELICGVRLKVGGQTIGWTLADYLRRLEEETLQKLEEINMAERRAAE